MRISRVKIQNFRNIKTADVQLGDIVTLIGENNSGKSNFLYALTLPFLSDDNNIRKNLTWADINSEVKDEYYQFILDKKDNILNRTLSLEDFTAKLPVVSVEVDLVPDEKELYCVKDISYSVDVDGNILYGLRYEYKTSHPEKGTKVAYDTLRQFKYMALSADRDSFSNTDERIGSKSLVRLLQMRLSDTDLLTVEKEYSRFFDALKNLSGMEQVINW